MRSSFLPWFIATETFNPSRGEAWAKYVAWSGLTHLDEVVSLDGVLCPTVLPEIKDEYWPHIVNEDFMLNYFVDLDFLLAQISSIPDCNLLRVYRNPPTHPRAIDDRADFEFLGYDLVDVGGSTSALTNCGGFPEVFANDELSCKGLLSTHERALEVQGKLRAFHSGERHADCDVWAIFRAIAH